MTQVNVQDAKTRLSDLLSRAERGENATLVTVHLALTALPFLRACSAGEESAH